MRWAICGCPAPSIQLHTGTERQKLKLVLIPELVEAFALRRVNHLSGGTPLST
jgi:hypothetical protein